MMKAVMNIWLSSLFLSLASVILAGTPNITDSIFHIKPVSITRQKPLVDHGLNKSETDSLTLSYNTHHTLSGLLSKHTPVFIRSYGQGSLATASFRGTSASHTQVEWNGINISNPMLGQTDLALIPVYFVDEVTLLYGSSSMINTVGAIGGSVHLSSIPVWNRTFHGEIVQGAGSFGTYRTAVSLGGGNRQLQVRIRTMHEQSENDFQYLNTANGLWNYEKQEHAGYSMNGIMGEINYRKEKHKLSAYLWLQGSDRNLPPIMSYEGNGREETQEDRHTRTSLKWYYYGKNIKSRLIAGYSRSLLHYYLANQTGEGYVVNYNSTGTTQSVHNKYTLEAEVGPSTVLRGIVHYDFHMADFADEQTLTGYNASRSETGAALSIHHRIAGSLSSYLLLRGELAGRDLSPLMPSLGLEYAPLKYEMLAFKLNLGRNYHHPSMNDLYWVPGGNPELRPEEGYSMDVTADFSGRIDSVLTIQSKLSGFVTVVNDWIIWQPGEYGYWQADNIRKVFSRGLEYAVTATINIYRVKADIYGNYSFTRTTNATPGLDLSEGYGRQLMYIPLHKGSGILYVSAGKYLFSYGLHFTGERFTTMGHDDTNHTLEGYTLHHISAGRTFSAWKLGGEIRVQADNLLNKDYQSILWRPMPGRSYSVLLKLSF